MFSTSGSLAKKRDDKERGSGRHQLEEVCGGNFSLLEVTGIPELERQQRPYVELTGVLLYN